MISFSNIGNMGRFGNQMFQLAATVGIARKIGLDPVFPLERFEENPGPDSYSGCKLLECFDIPMDLIKPSNQIEIRHIYYEREFSYNRETENIPDLTTLSGYYQSEKYFNHVEDEVRKIFTFRKEIIDSASSYNINKNGVSVHVRRGDYLGSPDHHPTQTLEYYKEAIKKFDSNSNFYIFSDDPEWCRNNMGIENSTIIESNNPYIDIYLMSKCDGHIIANSSFSWWGSWLANSKKTIAPLRWFGPSLPHETSDIYCKNWIKL